MSNDSVIRTLKELHEDKVIEIEKGYIHVIDINKLRKISMLG